MYDFLTNITLVVSSGVIIYLLARALPRVPDVELSPNAEPGAFERFMRRIPLAKIDTALSAFFEKWLRKMRVMVLKTENIVSAGIKRMQSKTSVPPPPGSLFEKKEDDPSDKPKI
ncbi:MAG: hypothetical protein Q7R85_03740 [bacterium]|nr:hypothetical protein [bacterium]